jgi:hypothetical protein
LTKSLVPTIYQVLALLRTDPFRSSGDAARPDRVEVDDHLRVVRTTSTYAIGDVAGGTGPGGAVLPMLASPAMQAGRFVAAEILGSRESAFRYREKGMLATIGRRAAVGQVGPISFNGMPSPAERDQATEREVTRCTVPSTDNGSHTPMPNKRRKPTQNGSDEGITLPLEPEPALKVTLGDDDVKAIDMADLPGLRTTAEWDGVPNEEIEALGDSDAGGSPSGRPPKKLPVKRTLPEP